MAVYVAVSNESYDKTIKSGPYELEDPSQQPVHMGTHLMLESEALAAGYHYAADGAFTAPEPNGKGHKKDKGNKGGKGRKADADE
ncbi:hypothetical protein [Streptomyces sp. NPDC088360]|uniref:hypothetical protein n=1 Tax=Streptomyces sp. NPDC088360 TaxID=3154515 RepID=UPI00344E032E